MCGFFNQRGMANFVSLIALDSEIFRDSLCLWEERFGPQSVNKSQMLSIIVKWPSEFVAKLNSHRLFFRSGARTQSLINHKHIHKFGFN